jgi:hypothetical protein
VGAGPSARKSNTIHQIRSLQPELRAKSVSLLLRKAMRRTSAFVVDEKQWLFFSLLRMRFNKSTYCNATSFTGGHGQFT